MEKISYTLTAAGTSQSGQLQVESGAELSVLLNNATKAKLGFDYTSPDKVILTVSGAFTIKAKRPGDITVISGLSKNILDGSTAFNGSISWTVSKKVALEAQTQFGRGPDSLGARVTLTF